MRVILGISGIFLVIFLVIRLFSLSNVCAVCTLVNVRARSPCFSALVWGIGFPGLEMDLFFFTVYSVSFNNCCSSSALSLLPMFLIALVQPAMAAIILSEWVMVGLVIF